MTAGPHLQTQNTRGASRFEMLQNVEQCPEDIAVEEVSWWKLNTSVCAIVNFSKVSVGWAW